MTSKELVTPANEKAQENNFLVETVDKTGFHRDISDAVSVDTEVPQPQEGTKVSLNRTDEL